MSRSVFTDPASVRSFMIVDVGKVSPDNDERHRIGLTNVAFGHSNLTMPEVSLEMTDLKEAFVSTPFALVTDVSISTITLSRGIYIYDNEFFSWIKDAVNDSSSSVFRRDLLIMWYKERLGVKSLDMPLKPQGVPLKVFMLKDTIPIRYKPGSDFDAMSSDISIQELELRMKNFLEISPASIWN